MKERGKYIVKLGKREDIIEGRKKGLLTILFKLLRSFRMYLMYH